MENVFLKLVNMSIDACWLVLAVLVLRFIFKKAPKWINDILWGIVAVRLVCPFSLKSIFSLMPDTETISQNVLNSQGTQISGEVSAVTAQLSSAVAQALPPETTGTYPALSVTFILSMVWLCGVVIMFMYAAGSYISIFHRLREAVAVEDNAYLCDRISSPFVFGVIKPRIYLSPNLSQSDTSYVILHEKAHIKRRDYIRKPLGFLLLSVYWFNPAIWLAFILFCRDIELACDERVIKQLGTENKKAYSQALINCSAPQRTVAACPVAFGETGVKSRIKSILNYKKPAFWVIAVALIACLVAAVCLLTDPKKENGFPDGWYKLGEAVYTDGGSVFDPDTADAVQIEIDESSIYFWSGEQLMQGGLFEKTELSEENFASLFKNSDGFENGLTADSLKKGNKQVITLSRTGKYVGDFLYMVLEQKDGTVYCAYADFNGESPESIDTIYKMEFTQPSGTVSSLPYFDTDVPSLDATVLEVHEGLLLVKAESSSNEDWDRKIYVSLNGVEIPEAKKGSKVTIYYDGVIAETYPEQLLKPYYINVWEDGNILASYALSGDAYKIYAYQNPASDVAVQIMLSQSDDRFSFAWSPLSSYFAYGKYELTEDRLTLKTDDGENIYVFDRRDDGFAFDEENSDKIPAYKASEESDKLINPVPDGAVFTESGSTNAQMPTQKSMILDKIIFDIDGDGINEVCILSSNPLISADYFTINAYSNGKVEYSGCYVPGNISLKFEKGEDGKTRVKLTKPESHEVHVYDISVNGDRVILSENGKELGS